MHLRIPNSIIRIKDKISSFVHHPFFAPSWALLIWWLAGLLIVLIAVLSIYQAHCTDCDTGTCVCVDASPFGFPWWAIMAIAVPVCYIGGCFGAILSRKIRHRLPW